MKKITVLLFIVFSTISCNETKKKTKTPLINKEELTANYKSIEVEIEGMTCEIGCARLIQSKLSKVDGVTYTKVDFDSKKGIFTFDSNKLDKNDISTKIAQIAGGDLYSVTKTTELEEIIKKNEEIIEKNK